MDYEKKYKETIAWIDTIMSTLTKEQQEDALEIFPELAESEDDRIRKSLIILLQHFCKGYRVPGLEFPVSYKDMLAWLEKQGECHISHDDEIMIKQLTEYFTTGHGLQNTNETVVEWLNNVKEKLEKRGEAESDSDDIEAEEKGIREAFNKIEDEKQCKQKPQRMISAEVKEAMYDKSAEEVEPKFKEGEWLCENEPNNYARFIQILEIVNVQGKDRYRISRDIHKDEDVVEFGFVEKYYHKFDIQDAKDGDVLAAHECLVLFKKLDGLNIKCYCTYHYMGFNPSFYVDTLQNKDAFHPATKEQRNLLFQKMKEAGYKWDADKEELKKISQRMISAEAKEAMYAKPAWSEDDEEMLVDAYVMLDWYKGNNWWTARRIKDWLNSLKERIRGISYDKGRVN